MKNIIAFSVSAIILLLSSCSTTDDVVSSRAIQKRKYNRGFHVDLKSAPTKDASMKNSRLPEKSLAMAADEESDTAPSQTEMPLLTNTAAKNHSETKMTPVTSYTAKSKNTESHRTAWFGIKRANLFASNTVPMVKRNDAPSSFIGISAAYDKSQLMKWIVVAVIGLIIALVGGAIAVWILWYLGWLIWTLGVVMVILVLLEII